MNNKLSIFIGPKRTGTTWLHSLLQDDTVPKEIRYPVKYGKNYVYNRYVYRRSVLVWPYLIHDYESLVSLLDDLRRRGIESKLYFSLRDEQEHRKSYEALLVKQGARKDSVQQVVNQHFRQIKTNLVKIRAHCDVTDVRIINAEENDYRVLSDACQISIDVLKANAENVVYATGDTSRFEGIKVVDWFFTIKPFLPVWLQSVTKLRFLRCLFFKNSASGDRQ